MLPDGLWNDNNTTGYHLRDSIESHNIEIRYSGPLFTKNTPNLIHCITPSWIYYAWEFMQEKNMSL